MAIKIKLGAKAGVFHDPSIGLTIRPGEVVELSEAKSRSPRIKVALNGGHIMVVSNEKEEKVEVDVEAVKAKFEEMVNAGKEPRKITKAFNIDQIKALAKSMDIEPEEGDTKDDLVNAILEEYAPVQE